MGKELGPDLKGVLPKIVFFEDRWACGGHFVANMSRNRADLLANGAAGPRAT
jgi:hypothetical protein